MRYAEKLKDPRWQRKRLEILNRDNWTCAYCGDTQTTLHVHHEEYEQGKEPWEVWDYLLTTLCADCHQTIHFAKTPLEKFLMDCVLSRMIRHGEDLKMFNNVLNNLEV